MTIRRLVRVLGVCAVAAPAVLCMTACTTTPPAPPAPSGLTLEVPSATGGFVSATPLIPATTSSAANFFVLPLASTTAPIVRATLSTPYPSELRMTVLDVTRNVTVDLPQLPSGYFGMFPLSYVPPLWFRVMDPRLMALPHVRGDLRRVNVDPRRRESLAARYGAGEVRSCGGGAG